MPKHIGKETLKGLNDCGNVLRESTVLVLGLAYKPNVGDIRTSAVGGTIDKLQSYGVDVVGYDPHAEADAVVEAFDITVREELVFDGVDGILLATPHDEFLNIDFDAAVAGLVDEPLLIDVMGIFHPEQFVESPIQYKRI
jgi:UDP-N-acetyl-D-galactosamine dehydrogenase